MDGSRTAAAFALELAERGRARCKISGGSMGPLFSTAAFAHVVRSPEPRLRDVVVIELGGRLVMHRLVEIDRDRLVTRGDARRAADPPVALSALLGTVVALEDARGQVRAPAPRPGLTPRVRSAFARAWGSICRVL